MTPTQRAAMEQAMEALILNCGGHTEGKAKDSIAALKTALAEQPAEQEPVGEVAEVAQGYDEGWTAIIETGLRKLQKGDKVYTAPQPAKPAEQEAVNVGSEWTPCVKLPVTVHVRKQRPGETHVSTREGITPIKPDDLIMRGVSGEEYPIGREIFERTYRLGEAPQPAKRVPLTVEDIDSLMKRTLETLGWTMSALPAPSSPPTTPRTALQEKPND